MGRSIPAKEKPKAVVLAVNLGRDPDFASQVQETIELAKAADYQVVDVVTAARHKPDRQAFVGKGKIEEVTSCLDRHQAQILILNHTLADGQHSKLASEIGRELLDYSGLILTIFAKRAVTAEGKLQVELAQENYGKAKLKGAWTHLERQRGGLGATGGPGERQIELDRRMTASRISKLRKKLKKRDVHTKLVSSRRKRLVPTIALVGYTNAGKSTLFSQLAKNDNPASSRLFETLTTTSRRIHLGEDTYAVLSDTVGFIRNLPHELIESFRSTLNEAVEADLLLVVLDASDPGIEAKYRTVQETLESIGAGDVPHLLLLNKVDLCTTKPASYPFSWDKIGVLPVSASSGQGLTELRLRLTRYFTNNKKTPQHCASDDASYKAMSKCSH